MKVTFFPLQAHCFAFGGFEIQMLSTYNAIKDNTDVEVSLIDPWNRNCHFDIAHFWGLDIANYQNIFWAKKLGKKTVMTVLLGNTVTKTDLLKAHAFRLLRVGNSIRNMLNQIDAFIVVNAKQKQVAIDLWNIPETKIFIVPNTVNKKFFDIGTKQEDKPFEKYILTAGNICNRKNQLNLAKACAYTDINLVLVGKVLTGEDAYGKVLEDFIKDKENILWIRGLPEYSNELVNLVRNSSAFALLSNQENQPISLLEAVACEVPLIISDEDFAYQEFYENSFKVNQLDVDSIRKAIETVVNDPDKYMTPKEKINNCLESAVGRSYADVYKCLSNKTIL